MNNSPQEDGNLRIGVLAVEIGSPESKLVNNPTVAAVHFFLENTSTNKVLVANNAQERYLVQVRDDIGNTLTFDNPLNTKHPLHWPGNVTGVIQPKTIWKKSYLFVEPPPAAKKLIFTCPGITSYSSHRFTVDLSPVKKIEFPYLPFSTPILAVYSCKDAEQIFRRIHAPQLEIEKQVPPTRIAD